MVRLIAVSAALTLFSGAYASSLIAVRTDEPPKPACDSPFTPFKYAGCFMDTSTPRSLPYNGPSNDDMTVESCIAFCKGNNYKYAGLEYYNECFCGESVMSAQVDESFCSYPCAGNKSEICGGTDYISVYQDPTYLPVDKTVISDYKPLGCYSEGTQGRALIWRQDQVPEATLTVDACLRACKDGGYPFAGVEYSQECYCGVVLGNGTTSIDDAQCSLPCKGNSAQMCGGYSTLNLYVATDLQSSEPCGSESKPSSLPSSALPSSTSSSSPSSSKPTSSAAPSSNPTTSAKPTTSPATLPTTTTTKPTASLCTTTVTTTPSATCEYKCGRFCSSPIPPFADADGCKAAVSHCAVQVASCFLTAGWPFSLKCFEFSSWCSSISKYCGSSCPGNSCSRTSCKSKNPPSGPAPPSPTVTTSVYTCPAPTAKASSTVKTSSTTAAASATSCVPVPVNSNVCNQPNNPWKGYTSDNPVGNLPLPCLTCNNYKPDFFNGNPFKLYTDPISTNCRSFGRGNISSGCKLACNSQYNSCINNYAEGCKANNNPKRGDTYNTASQKCYNQLQDCYSVNANVNVRGSRCGGFNSGWF